MNLLDKRDPTAFGPVQIGADQSGRGRSNPSLRNPKSLTYNIYILLLLCSYKSAELIKNGTPGVRCRRR